VKRLLFVVALQFVAASELENLLNNNYSELFDLELQKSIMDKNFDTKSWISPIMLTWQRDCSNQIGSEFKKSTSFSVGIDQPIFKSGGIYYGIKFAKAKYDLANINIEKEKKRLIANAIELLFKIKQTKLNIAKLKLQLKNSKIDVANSKELYSAGMVDSIILDTAMAKEQQSQIAILNLQQTLAELRAAFAKISSKNPDRLKVPKLHLVNEDQFLDNNLDIKLAKSSVRLKKYTKALTASKYLPTVSVGARYTKISPTNPSVKDSFTNYSIRVSMPLSVNVASDLERAKLDTLIEQIKAKNSIHNAKIDYNLVKKKLEIINRQIALANKEASIYKKLYLSTKRLYKAGQKSINDVKLLKNSYNIKRLDAKIYAISKNIELLKLYAKMR
jgi:outer membrane protein TolC